MQEGATFKDWLAARVGQGEGQVPRRELARRLADMDPSTGDEDSYRSSLRRILKGERNPSQRTRDSIQKALDDYTAPSVDDEARDTPITRELIADKVDEKIARAERELREWRTELRDLRRFKREVLGVFV